MFETPDSRFRRWLPRVLYVVLIVVLAFIALRALDFLRHSLAWPLSICLDASILRFESWSMLNGVWPWRDIVSINLPLTHYIHIAGLGLFGSGDRGFRLLDAVYILITAVLTALYLLRISKLAAFAGFCLTLLLPHEATPYGAFQREVLMLPLWLGALWLAEVLYERLAAQKRRGDRRQDPKKAGPWILMGVMAVLTVAIKPTAALLFLFFGLAFVFAAFRSHTTAESLALLARGFFVSIIAALATAALVFLPLVWADSNLPAAFLSSWLNQTGAYAAVVTTIPPERLLGDLFTFQPLHWTLALNQPLGGPTDTGHLSLLHLTLFALWLLFAGRPGRSMLLGLFALAALLQYLLQMRGFQYHLYPLWYACILAAAQVFSDLMRAKETDGLKFAALFFALSFVLQQNNSLNVYKGTGLYDRGHPENVPRFQVPGEIGRIAGLIRKYEKGRTGAATAAGEKRPFYFQTFEHATIALGAAIPNDLTLASRYPVDYIVWEESKYRKAAREDMLKALRERRPAILAYGAGHTPEQKKRLSQWPALSQWIRRSYLRTKIITEVNGDEYWIFVRRDYARLAR